MLFDTLPDRISRTQMADAIDAASLAGEVNADNGWSQPEPTYGAWWARACAGITIVSVLPSTESGAPMEMRWDQPGSMHPMHYAPIMFASDDLSATLVRYIRERTGRLILVMDDRLAP